MSRAAQSCTGTFPITGTLKGDQIDVRAAEKFGSGGDCTFRPRGTLTGNKIHAKIGSSDIELSK